jgi:hypothetical protein
MALAVDKRVCLKVRIRAFHNNVCPEKCTSICMCCFLVRLLTFVEVVDLDQK